MVIFKYSFDLILVNVKNLKIKPGIFCPRNHPASLHRIVPRRTRTDQIPIIMDHIGLDNEDSTTSGDLTSTGLDRTRTDKNQKNSEELRPSVWIDGSTLEVIQRMHIKVQIGLYIANKCICEKLSRFLVLNSECTNLK